MKRFTLDPFIADPMTIAPINADKIAVAPSLCFMADNGEKYLKLCKGLRIPYPRRLVIRVYCQFSEMLRESRTKCLILEES